MDAAVVAAAADSAASIGFSHFATLFSDNSFGHPFPSTSTQSWHPLSMVPAINAKQEAINV